MYVLFNFDVSKKNYFKNSSQTRLDIINIFLACISGLVLIFWLFTKYTMNRQMELELWINKTTKPPIKYYEKFSLYIIKSLLGVGMVN